MWKKRLITALGLAVVLGLLVASLRVLHYELGSYRFRDIGRSLKAISSFRIAIAILFTALSYLVLTGYDALALRYLARPIGYRKTAFASFLGYVFSYNIGLSILGGGTVRYRLYSLWGFTPVEIGKIIAFSGLTFWLGLLSLCGVVFIVEPPKIPDSIKMGFQLPELSGYFLLIGVIAYLVFSGTKKRRLTIKGEEFALPDFKMAVLQILLAWVDLAIAGLVLFTLLDVQGAVSFPLFLGIYMVGLFLGLISHVPGGVGIFESVILVFLSPSLSSPKIVGGLFAYRLIYYLLPFLVALISFVGFEIRQQKEHAKKIFSLGSKWIPEMAPRVLASTTFIAGGILLFSGATPMVKDRVAWIHYYLPLPVVELSHFLGSLCGVALLILARGIHRRLDAAYQLTVGILVAGILFSLLKGFDYEEAILLAIMLSALISSRSSFHRKSTLLSQRLSIEWLLMLGLVLITTTWLGIFSYKHVEYSHDLWWHFTFSANAPRFLRATVGVSVAILFYGLARLLRAAPKAPSLASDEEIAKALPIVTASESTVSSLALLGDKSLLFNEKNNAFIMFGAEGNTWVALGDPVGPEAEWADLIWAFREHCDDNGCAPAFYQVTPQSLHYYLETGLRFIKLGEEAIVPLQDFSLEGGSRKSLRQAYHRTAKDGFLFEVISKEQVPELIPQLKAISDSWLGGKNVREKGFSLGFFSEAYLTKFPCALVKLKGETVGFANLLCGDKKKELSIDLMRYRSETSPGIMDYLFIELFLWGKKEGYESFNLGMAPLSGLENRRLAPFWNRLAALAFHHGEHFYNFQGLRQYKEKFHPRWEPRFLASPGGLFLPGILTNISSLISGGLKGVIAK